MTEANVSGHDGFPYETVPRGWFQIGWAHEVPDGEAISRRYFGQDLALYRAGDGSYVLTDAHCPHLGAHLGHGGLVEDNCLRCPFHGWLWNACGENVEIPYSETVMKGRLLNTWSVVEAHGVLFAWHDPDGGQPKWDPPSIPELAEIDSTYYYPYPALTHVWRNVQARPQNGAENAVDFPHQQWVHKAPSPSRLVSFDADGHVFRSEQRFIAGYGKERTWLTPDGPVEAVLTNEIHGIGLVITRYLLTDNSVHIHGKTPVGPDLMDEFLTVLARRDPESPDAPDALAERRFAFEIYQFERDIKIWEHMRFVQKPMYAPEEAAGFRAFRSWAAQFYERQDAGDVIESRRGRDG